MIIRQLPLQSLLQAARVCRQFQLEAEACIYRSIHVDQSAASYARFRSLKRALLAKPRRQVATRKIEILNRFPRWPETVAVLLPLLPNLKTLTIITLDLPNTVDSAFLFKIPARLEELWVRALILSEERLVEFLDSQPSIRTLCLSHFERHNVPLRVLPHLMELVTIAEVLPQYVPGRPVKKVHRYRTQIP